ncbi:hypothetical protein ACA910_021344 [Epithemia clementina (nom. ined.)]
MANEEDNGDNNDRTITEMPSSAASSSKSTEIDFSEHDVEAFMSLILDRAAAVQSTKTSRILYSPTLGLYMTMSGVKIKFVELVHELGGRCSTEQASQLMGISTKDLMEAMKQKDSTTTEDDDDDKNNINEKGENGVTVDSIHRLYPIQTIVPGEEPIVEYVSEDYINNVVTSIQQRLSLSENGFLPVVEVLSSLPSSHDKTAAAATATATATTVSSGSEKQWLELLRSRLSDCDIVVRPTEQGCHVFHTRRFWESFCAQVFGTLSALSHQKTLLSHFCQEHSLDVTWVKDALCHPPAGVQHLVPPGELQGNGHYVPHLYKELQHKMAVNAFLMQGFVDVEQLRLTVDLAPSQIIQHIQVQCGDDDVCRLDSLVMSRDRILFPWITMFQDADASKACCEFTVPLEMISPSAGSGGGGTKTVAAQRLDLLEECLVSEAESKGCAGTVLVVKDGNALYASNAMLQALTKVHFPVMVATFAAKKAQSLLETDEDNKNHNHNNHHHAENKSVDLSSSLSSSFSKIFEADDSVAVPPITAFVDMVWKHYSSAFEGGDRENHLRITASLGPGEDDGLNETTVLHEFCRRTFLSNDQVRATCCRALQNEVERWQRRQKRQRAVHVGDLSETYILVDGDQQDHTNAMRVMDEIILLDFEDPACFPALCFRLQTFLKFYDYAEKHAMESLEQLRVDIQQGCCGDFTRRIHQYCFSKREDLSMTTFSFHDATNANDRLPVYCSAIDIATPRFGPAIQLSCSPDPDTGRERDPLSLLRQLLPGPVGQALCRQYELCLVAAVVGADHDGAIALHDFLAHAEEHTITICGLPFKKLDKKNEKNYLQSRRQVLRSRLEQASSEPSQVLEFTIMILYQQVKNLCVAGILLTGPILSLLIQERKMPKAVAECLTNLAGQLKADGNQTPDPVLVEHVRECGLSKDISKHVIPS